MSRFNYLLMTFLLTFSITLSAGEFKVNGELIGDSSVIEYITANYEARVIKIVTNGSAHFSRIDDTVDEPGQTQQQLVVDDVVIGSSDLITWFLINPNNNNVRLKTNGNLEIVVDQPARNPQITQFKASASTITEGDELTLTWKSTDTDYCEASEDFIVSGQLPTNGSESFTEATVGNRSYELTCFAELGSEIFQTVSAVSVTVEADQGGGGGGDPGIESFTASSQAIAQGEPITLSWRSNDVNYCEGKVDFSLDSSTDKMPINSSKSFTEDRIGQRTYVLWCYGAETYTASITVNVTTGTGTGTDPAIRSFVSSKSQPLVDEQFSLSWDAINVDSCTASGAWGGAKSTSGTQALSFASKGVRSFTLECTDNGTGTTVNKTITVNVDEEFTGTGVHISSFTATPNPVQVGTDVVLSWTSANAISCKGMQPGISKWVDIHPVNASISIRITEAGTKNFVLRCYEKNNTSTYVEATVIVDTTGSALPPVSTSLSVDKTTITEGESVSFSWSSSNATQCVTQGVAPGWANQVLSTSGTMVFTPRHDSMALAYIVECSNATSTAIGQVQVSSVLPAQQLNTSSCAVPFNSMQSANWRDVWPENWPGPNSFKQTITLNPGKNLAIKFNTGAQFGAEGWITSAPSIGTPGVRTMTITQCPGDYTYGQIGVPGSQAMDPDCTKTWGVGTFLKYIVDDNYVAGNGVCELASATDYYMNIRFSSRCTGSFCQGVFQYSRPE